jgi:serine/threonine-protein kinase RsbW
MGQLTLPSVPASVPQVRAFVQEELEPVLDEGALYDVLVATTEAAGNAVAHGGAGADATITTTCSSTGERVVVTIRDEGRGFQPDRVKRTMPDALAQGGRGLALVQTLMDSLQIRSGPTGTLLRMERLITG